MHYLISIGIILAITGIFLILFLKKPLQLSDKLLIVILGTFAVKFLLDEISLLTGRFFLTGAAAIFGISSIVTCGWYIKYLTNTEARFEVRQVVIYIPLLILMIPTILVMHGQQSNAAPGIYYWYVLVAMVGLVLYYFWFCIDMLRKHRKLIKEYYSGESGDITVNWIIIILAIQIAEFFLKAVLGRFVNDSNLQIVTNEYCYIIEILLLVVLGVWQKSIPVFMAADDEVISAVLHVSDLKRYQQKL